MKRRQEAVNDSYSPSSANQQIGGEPKGEGLRWRGDKSTQLGDVSSHHRALWQFLERGFRPKCSSKPAYISISSSPAQVRWQQ